MRFRPDTEAMILGALANGPLHGYGIVKCLKENSDGLFKLNEGQLYPMLFKMQESGWIIGEWETEGSGPARKIYSLTVDGTNELQRKLSDWDRFSKAVQQTLLTKMEVRNA